MYLGYGYCSSSTARHTTMTGHSLHKHWLSFHSLLELYYLYTVLLVHITGQMIVYRVPTGFLIRCHQRTSREMSNGMHAQRTRVFRVSHVRGKFIKILTRTRLRYDCSSKLAKSLQSNFTGDGWGGGREGKCVLSLVSPLTPNRSSRRTSKRRDKKYVVQYVSTWRRDCTRETNTSQNYGYMGVFSR